MWRNASTCRERIFSEEVSVEALEDTQSIVGSLPSRQVECGAPPHPTDWDLVIVSS